MRVTAAAPVVEMSSNEQGPGTGDRRCKGQTPASNFATETRRMQSQAGGSNRLLIFLVGRRRPALDPASCSVWRSSEREFVRLTSLLRRAILQLEPHSGAVAKW